MKTVLPIIVLILGLFTASCSSEKPVSGEPLLNLRFEEDYTPTYYEIIEMYQLLDQQYANARLLEYGLTDSGKPLHLFVIDQDGDFDPVKARARNKQIILINNGIHPGEPCGIDASLKYADDLLRNFEGSQSVLENTVICIIPVYNVGGCLFRSHFNRTNQPGPYESGYRGNAKNLDLNRDFVKMDTENAKSFARIFRNWKPDVFLDTHTTNGSDHQYCITLIPAQHNSMQEDLGNFFSQKMIPDLYKRMLQTPYELIPYVMYTNRNPESGITNYVQGPKYSTGYTQLFNTLSFMTENHCYKPYPDRVKSAYHFIRVLVNYTAEHGKEIREARTTANEKIKQQELFPLDYQVDTSNFQMIEFKGYGRGTRKALLTGETFPDYDYEQPFTKTVPFFDNFLPTKTVRKPAYYVLPQAWTDVADRLKINQVKMFRLSKDTSLTVNVYYIEDLQWDQEPANGHFYHSTFTTRQETQVINYYAGDYVIPVDQDCNQLIVNQLEPEGMDSYFRWNFFDQIFENREWFSPHPVLEEKMVAYMDKHPEIRKMLDEEIARRPEIAQNRSAQMYYIYQTIWENPGVNRYPVARIEQTTALPVI